MRIGVDTGGTFTDLVGDDGSLVKVASTPDDPARAVGEAISQVTARTPSCWRTARPWPPMRCSSATSGALRSSRTRGFSDVIEIARQARPSLYDQHVDRPPAARRRARCGSRSAGDSTGPVPRSNRSTVTFPRSTMSTPSRCASSTPISMHRTNARSRTALAARGLDVVCSHEVSPEFREYERMVTTVVDAALRPVCRAVPPRVASLANEVLVMTSAGGLVPLEDAARRPASLLLSGPVAGVQRGGGRRGGVRLSRRGVVRHGRHEHRRVPRPRRCAGARADARHRRVPDPAPRASRSTPSARAAARSPGSTPAARSSSVPRARGARPGRRATGAAASTRRSPTPTSCSGASRPTRRLPGSAASMPTAARRALDACRSHCRRRRRGRRRVDGTCRPRRDRRAGRRPARPRARRVRWRRTAARVRGRRRARDARGDRSAPSGCVLGRRARVVAAAPRARAVVADARVRGGSRRVPSTRWHTTRRRQSVAPRSGRDVRRLPVRGSEPRAHGAPSDEFPAEHERRNGYTAAWRAGRGRRDPRPRVARRRRSRSSSCPSSHVARVVGPEVVDRARLHGVGTRRLGRRAGRARRVGDDAPA